MAHSAFGIPRNQRKSQLPSDSLFFPLYPLREPKTRSNPRNHQSKPPLTKDLEKQMGWKTRKHGSQTTNPNTKEGIPGEKSACSRCAKRAEFPPPPRLALTAHGEGKHQPPLMLKPQTFPHVPQRSGWIIPRGRKRHGEPCISFLLVVIVSLKKIKRK